jgi:uncharacterized heparinase superfamily protein
MLLQKTSLMLSWLEQMTFKNGDIPLFNDAANGIAPTSQLIFDYANHLKVKKASIPLKESGYRLFNKGSIELIVDVGQIGPDYIPGHAHSDTLNFSLYVDNAPFIIDTGTSTYENNSRRHLERSTSAHNSVTVNDKEQSEIWGSFRVARRAYSHIEKESNTQILSWHDGYKSFGVVHKRNWIVSESKITIEDNIVTANSCFSIAHFHFDPSIELSESEGEVFSKKWRLKFEGAISITLGDYQFAKGFNHLITAKKVEVQFQERLDTIITF